MSSFDADAEAAAKLFAALKIPPSYLKARIRDNRPKTYKGKQVEYRGEISDRESFEGKPEGIYYRISTGSYYCYYDGVDRSTLDLWLEPCQYNPEMAGKKPRWYSDVRVVLDEDYWVVTSSADFTGNVSNTLENEE